MENAWRPSFSSMMNLLIPFLLLAAMIPSGKGESVAVVALETYQGYLCRSFNENSTLTNMTHAADTLDTHAFTATSDGSSAGFCVLARPETKQPLNPSYIFSFKTANVTVAAGIDQFSVWVSVNEERSDLNATLRPEAWNNLCLGVTSVNPMELATPTPAPPRQEADPDSTNYKVWASLQGRPLDLKFAGSMSAWGELGGDVRLCLGAEGPDNASFTGMITGVTLLTKEEVEEQEQEQKKEEKGEKKEKEEGIRTTGNCSVLLARNILTHPLDVSWTTKGPVLTLEWELPLDPCLTPPKTVWLQGSRAYQGSLRLCRSLGGHFPTEEEATGDLLKAHNCSTGDVLTWASGWEESEDDPTALCPVLLAEGGMDKWACYSKLDCTLCLVPEGLTYTLFGARRDFDRHYTLRTLADGTFEFQGQDTSTISQGELGWRLSSSLHNDELIQGSWVMGRQRWHPSGSLQQPTTTLPYKATEKTINTSTDILTFTVCNAIQFSSDDGVCLLRSERCDGRTDSPDGSDEEHCGSRRAISKDTNYDTRVSPFLGRKQKGILLYEIHVMFINKMSTEKGMASVEMNLYLDWEDSRIEFVDTKMGRNSLACDDIWTPTLNVFAGYTRGPVVQPRSNRSDCYIYWDQKPREEQQLGDPLMSRSFTKMNITQYQNLVMEFPCLLRVSKYPFGKYMCNLTFGIFRDHEYIKWKSMRPLEEDYNDLKYYGDRDLLDFRLEKVL